MEERLAGGFLSPAALELPKVLAWEYGVILAGLIVVEKDEGWLCVVKATRRGKPVVAYVFHDTYQMVVEMVTYRASLGDLRFKVDERPPGSNPSDPPPLQPKLIP